MTSALIYNGELIERIAKENGKSAPNIDELVLNGKWTLELFNEISSLAAISDNESNTNEDFVMLLDNSEFDVLADGQSEWKKLKNSV